MAIFQRLSANPQNHRPVPLDQKLESSLPVLARTSHKSFQELTIGQTAQDASGEQTPELDEVKTQGWFTCHDIHSPIATLHLPVVSRIVGRRFRFLILLSERGENRLSEFCLARRLDAAFMRLDNTSCGGIAVEKTRRVSLDTLERVWRKQAWCPIIMRG
jgi:hypothetical protein